ncbi:DUF1501 domain-containing protein [uncultured Imperialibacter sp.]|uniref:DUF1501 domain-containing protein n=1 Tax=uncultured Imperialibacter sp. TaxID=1672639 RepID=UPI0030DDA8DA
MKRRQFIKRTSLATSAAFVPLFLKPFESSGSLRFEGRNLVIVQLSGGNDGLNTLVPFNNDLYYQNRAKIGLTKSELILLNDEIGLNRGLSPLKRLYDQGYLAIINSVGYPNPNRSHFRSMDIWHSASGSDQYLSSGWIGRYLDAQCYPPHAAVEATSNLSLALKGEKVNGFAAGNSLGSMNSQIYNSLAKNFAGDGKEMLSEGNLGYLYKTIADTHSSTGYLKRMMDQSPSGREYPGTSLGRDLKLIADLIIGGSETSVYYASLGGFDSHQNQGKTQEIRLGIYADAIESFVNDLTKNDKFKETVIFTFSEFGRRVQENASEGTDHGTANVAFVIGDNLKQPGLINTMPDLSNLDENGDLIYQIDFRAIYSTLLSKHLNVKHESIIGSSFGTLDFL